MTDRAGVSLSRIARRLEAADLLVSPASADPVLTGISDDSRRVRPGDLFCAWSGTSVDGHSFVAAALDAGAVAALVERPVPGCELPQLVVRQGRLAAAAAAAALFGDPASEMALLGVTGTNGKSTTVWLLQHLLSARHAAAIGTLGVYLPGGIEALDAGGLTTPGPVGLAALLRELRDRGAEVVAMEVSSHALDQGRVSACRFRAAVFTTFSRDHLDYHVTLEAYLAAKLGLADLLVDDGVAVINADDAAWAALVDRAPRTLRFGLQAPEADVRAVELCLTAAGTRFRLMTPVGDVEVELPLLGEYNVLNALGAVAAALGLGVPLGEVAAGLRNVPPVPGRLERVAEAPCPVLRDYAHTPDALERTLAALRPLVSGRLIVVLGAGGERDRGKRPLMGRVAVGGADLAIVTSDNPRREDPERIIDDIVADLEAGSYLREVDRRAAIARALDLGRPDDLILLAGKGHETYQVIGENRIPFDEGTVVRELLAARGATHTGGPATRLGPAGRDPVRG